VSAGTHPSRAWRVAFWVAMTAMLVVLHRGDPMDSDDGIVLAGAWDMLLGRVIYQDFFVWAAPGSFYSVWAAWSLFGATYEVAKALGIASVLFTAWAVVRIAGLFTASRRAYLMALLLGVMSVSWPIVNYNVLSMPFLAWGTYFAARGCTDRRPRTFFVAGMCSGLGVLYLQHRGIALCAATALFCTYQALRSGRTWIRLLGWYAIGVVPFLLLFARWDLALVIDTLLRFPWERYQPDTTHRASPVLYLFVWLLLLGVVWLRRGRHRVDSTYVLVVQAALLAGAYRSWDWGHISVALFPLLASVAPLDWSPEPGDFAWRPLRRFLVVFSYASLALLALLPSLRMRLASERVRDVQALPTMRFIESHCGGSRYLWAGPFIPGLYFYTKKVNPTRFSVLVARQNRPEHVAEVLAALERARPPCVVLNYRIGRRWHTVDNAVDHFLKQHYEEAHRAGDTAVWVQRAAPDVVQSH
jgi:hypothetical protein